MSPDERLDTLERHVAALSAEVTALRAAVGYPPANRAQREEDVREQLRRPPPSPPRSTAEWLAKSGPVIESHVGRYGTLALAALVILMAVGAVIKMAVERGLITPEVRIVAGALVALALAVAGMVFRSRGEVRYGGVLLALSLAVVDLVAWGAGPRFHLVPNVVALSIVDLASVLLASLALHDDSEFLFTVALGGALSAPFVTADQGGTAIALLSYGGVVIAGGARAIRDAAWQRAFAVMVIGALVYALAAGSLPVSPEWYGPFLISLFAAGCAAAALLMGEAQWRSELPRALLAVGAVGALMAFDDAPSRPYAIVLSISIAIGALTQAALRVRGVPARAWRVSALLLPFIPLSMLLPSTEGGRLAIAVSIWGVMAFVAWQMELRDRDVYRSSTHLLAAGIMGSLAVTAWLWDIPLAFVAGLAGWGVVLAWVVRDEAAWLPIVGVALACGAAVLSSVDQLASRNPFGYTPFLTRSSLSALCAALGLGGAGLALSRGTGETARVASRGVRLGILIGFLIVWGRMEVAKAFSTDLSAFLLTSYYAACGVGSIVAGRKLRMGRLRVAGLGLAVYAAVKAVVEVTDIGSLPLRVGAYAAVGVFLLGAGYLYREERPVASEVMA